MFVRQNLPVQIIKQSVEVSTQTGHEMESLLSKKLELSEAESKQLKAQLEVISELIRIETQEYLKLQGLTSDGISVNETLEVRFKQACDLKNFYSNQYQEHVYQLSEAHEDLNEMLALCNQQREQLQELDQQKL